MGIVVGIGGASRAGKSTLSNIIKKWYQDRNVKIIHMDDFVFPEKEIPKIKGEVNWEVPESVDFAKLKQAIVSYKESSDIIIVEGILIFHEEKILSLYDRKIFIDIDYETFIGRKSKDIRWDEPDWFIGHIWTSYLDYGMIHTGDALRVDGTKSFNRELIKAYINSAL